MRSSFKILQVIDTLEPGGAEKVLVTISNILHAHQRNVTVLTILRNGPLEQQLGKDIPVICLHRKNKWDLFTMYRLAKICRGFDLIHVHSSFNLRYLILSLKLFSVRKPIFFHEHFGNIEIDPSVRWHQKLIYPKTILIAVSRKIYEWAVTKLQMPASKVFLLPNVISVESKMRENKLDNTLRILLTSNFRRVKNIEFAIDVTDHLRKKQNCHLTIVGQLADKGYYDMINTKIQSQNLQENITIHHGVTDIQQLLPAFNLAIHTAVSESGPLVLIEYLAAGLPFISFETGEVAHQIKDELGECFVNNFDKAKWISKIENVLHQDQKQLSQKLGTIYQKFYSTESYYQRLLDIYQSALPENIA